MNNQNKQKYAAADPHKDQPAHQRGAAPGKAKAAMIMLHGRGAQALPFLALSEDFAQPDVHYLAPQASGHTWYPYPFTVPEERNEPHLGSALKKIDTLVQKLTGEGIPRERIILLGFSQGACLALHYAATNPGRYGGIVSLSGALIGDDPGSRVYNGNLDETPVFLGVGENEHYFSLKRFRQTADILRELNGNVIDRIYPATGHQVTEDEVKFVRSLLSSVQHNEELSVS